MGKNVTIKLPRIRLTYYNYDALKVSLGTKSEQLLIYLIRL